MATRQKKMTMMRKNLDIVKTRVRNLHNLALETTDDLVEGSLATGGKWQKISAKALKNGYTLVDKQQDLFFESLGTIKGQYTKGNRQLKHLFDFGFKKENVKKKIKSTTDDLKQITGIGPKMEKMLNTFGIKNFQSLADIDVKSLRDLLAKSGPRFKSLDPTAWIKEARKQIKK